MTHTQQRQPADHASSARSGSQRHLLTTDHVPSLSEGVADALQAVPLLLDATYGGQGNATARVAVLQRMQRAYGNRAVQRLLHADQSVHVGPNGQHTVLSQPSGADARVQRAPAPPPSLQDRVSDLERRQKTTEKRQAATEQDSKWRATISSRLDSYSQAILRVSTALTVATNGFQSAHMAQAQTEALKTQLFMAFLSVGTAAGFEYVFSFGLGKLGLSAKRIKDVVEQWENPVNAVVSSSSNVVGARQSQTAARQGPPPSSDTALPGPAAGDPLTFMTSNLEAVKKHEQSMEDAFKSRLARMQGASDEEWDKFNVAEQERIYQGLFNDLQNVAKGAEDLKDVTQLAITIEHHLWALWIQGNFIRIATHTAIGSDIEDRLTAVGVAAAANVTLTGHFYSSNSPSDWRKLLISWATGSGIKEPITGK